MGGPRASTRSARSPIRAAVSRARCSLPGLLHLGDPTPGLDERDLGLAQRTLHAPQAHLVVGVELPQQRAAQKSCPLGKGIALRTCRQRRELALGKVQRSPFRGVGTDR
jgi:hypothetical protein